MTTTTHTPAHTRGIERLLLLGCALLALLLLPACGPDATGADWQPPAESSLPLGYTEQESVPAYVRQWRMPPGFAGFTARWNERAARYVETALTASEKELNDLRTKQIDIINKISAISPGDADVEEKLAAYNKEAEALQQRREFAQKEQRNLLERKMMGDYIVYRTRADLPQGLHWQFGDSEPELGDPAACKGGTLRLAQQRSFPNTLRVFGPNSNNATRRYIYDDLDLPLVRIHPGTGALIPGTADRWAVSEDGRTVYFHIDEAARFSNGDPLTTRDFIASLFLRTSPYAAEPFYADFYLTTYARITVYSNHLLAVTLTSPRPYAAFYAGSLPSAATRFYAEFGPDFTTRYLWRATPTTGGYALDPAGLTMGRQLTLTRVRNWWAAQRKYTRYSCNVDHIVYSFIAEGAKIRELFRIGELDALSARDADFWYEGLEIEPVHRGYIQRVHFANLWPRNCFGFHLNCASPTFADKQARIGFHHALNIRAVINTIFRGDYRQSNSYFSGFGEFTNPRLRARSYDPTLARKAFAAAGYTEEGPDGILHKPDGTRLQVVVSSRIDPTYAAAMNILREDAARCGLDLRLDQMDDTVFYLKVKNKQYTACIFSWGFTPPMPDASQFYLSQYAFGADGEPLPGTNNITATASPELDRAIYAARAATTEQEAIAAQHEVQQRIADTASWVPGWSSWFWRFAQWRWLRWPRTDTTRFCPPRYYDPLDSHLYWIDPAMKEATLRARARGESFPETEINIPLPPAP